MACAQRVDEVLVVPQLQAGEHVWIAARLWGPLVGGAWPFLVLRSVIRLPPVAVAVDPEPAVGAVEQIADLHGALVVRALAPRAELQQRAIGVLERRAVHVGRLLR